MTDAPHLDPQSLLAHRDFVRAVARSLLWDEHAAEDVVQQTWIAALGAPARVSHGWLGGVARNLAIKRLRGDRRRALREAAAARPEGVPSDADVLERERVRRSVVDEVLALAEPYRATLLLRYFEDLPPREVARRMDVPVETVRTRTRRAIETLRVRLDARHGCERRAFCGALVLWAGAPRGEPLAAATTGGVAMTTKLAATGAGAVVLGLAAWLVWPAEPLPAAPRAAAVAAPAAAPAPPPRAPAEDPAPAAPPAPERPKEPLVRGRVVDKEGRPAAGFEVWVTGNEVVAPDASGRRTGNVVRLVTGADGTFATVLPSFAACKVAPSPLPHPAFAPKPRDARDVTPPAEGVEFVVERMPTATLVVSVHAAADGKPVAHATVSFGGRAARQSPAGEGRLEALVRLADAAGDTVKVTAAAGRTSSERSVALREGERVEVRIEMDFGDALHGRVVDAEGRPIAGALAFLGEEDVARGDEPFKPFDEKRVRDGARSDADGRFALLGEGRWVTVWHSDAGPVTVPRSALSSVVLPARGTIRGVLRGGDGAPVPETKVFLDRVRETTTDAEGRFEFANVEPGTRGLSLTGGKPKAYVAVRVPAGAAADVELRPGLPTVSVEWPGRGALGRFVALVPLGPVGSLAIGEPKGGEVAARDVLPGRYLLLGEGGAVAVADVAGAKATATVGAGEIVVRAKPKTRVYVVPAESGYLARLIAGRQAGAGVPADGLQRFTGLAPGRYEVGVERDGVRATVEVGASPVEVAID